MLQSGAGEQAEGQGQGEKLAATELEVKTAAPFRKFFGLAGEEHSEALAEGQGNFLRHQS